MNGARILPNTLASIFAWSSSRCLLVISACQLLRLSPSITLWSIHSTVISSQKVFLRQTHNIQKSCKSLFQLAIMKQLINHRTICNLSSDFLLWEVFMSWEFSCKNKFFPVLLAYMIFIESCIFKLSFRIFGIF